MNNILITIKKELRSIFRDRKTLVRLLLFPLIIPIMILVYGELFESMDDETKIDNYNIGINYDIEQEELFAINNLNPLKYNNQEELQESYNNKEIEAYIIYDEPTNTYTIYSDEATNNGLTISSYINSYLESYSTYLTNVYLQEHNIDIEEAYDTFNIEYQSLSEKNYFLSLIISLSVTYIIMSIVVATGNMATGTTATEKENGTLETILTFPINKNELIIGKYLSSVIIGIIASLIAFILMIAGILFAENRYTMFDGTELILNFKIIIICLAIIIIASLFIAGIAVALCGMSKSYKEAQSSVSFLNLVTIIPLFLSMAEVSIKDIYYIIPIFNHEQIILDIFNNSFTYHNFILTISSSIIYIIIVIYLVIKAYNSEKILFNN